MDHVPVAATEPASPEAQQGPTWTRLQEQIDWYDGNATSNRWWFKAIKVTQIVLAAMVPVAATAGGERWLLAAFGAAVVVLEGVQQLFQFHRNWISYRATCEALRRERHLYLANARPYSDARDPRVALAERLELLVSHETADWASAENVLPATDSRKPEA